MEPFAAKSKPRLKLHWWVVAGIGGAFFIWAFDLVPRFREVAAGRVADSPSSGQSNAEELSFDGLPGFDDEPRLSDSSLHDSSDDPLFESNATSSSRRNDTHGDFEPTESVERSSSVHDSQSRRSSNDSTVTQASSEQVDAATARTASSLNDLVIPAEIAQRLRTVDTALESDKVLDAHAILSAIYWKEPELRPLIQERIDSTAATIFTSSERNFAKPHFVDYGETLESIAKQYEVPWQYLSRLNRVTPERLQAGQQLKVVRGPFAAVVDLSDFCLTVHAHGWYVHRYQIGTGRDQRTPTGEFTIQNKLENPVWYDPDGNVVDADDPQNPLGEYWLGLGDHIGIHGTIDPESIGQAASRGCIHLGDDDIAEVFALLSVGSTVMIRK